MSPEGHLVVRYRFWRAELADRRAPPVLVDQCDAELRELARYLIGYRADPLPASPLPGVVLVGERWG